MIRAPKKDDIVIAGYDMVTPLGTELESSWEAFAAGSSGVSWVGKYEVRESDAVRVAGEYSCRAVRQLDYVRGVSIKRRDMHKGQMVLPYVYRQLFQEP